jgi:phosphonate transport system substrate-binding protein
MSTELLLGSVCYDPKVVTICEGFKRYFQARGLPFDYVLYSNYDRQVDALLAGQIDSAWNSPLAWIRARRLAAAKRLDVKPFAMRDTDRDVRSVIIVEEGSSIDRIEALRGKTIAVGASDSPQATLIPLSYIASCGLLAGADFTLLRHEVLVGLHGDHVGGERDAASALVGGRADAACLLEGNYLAFIADGTIPPLSTSVLTSTPAYDHCNMTAGPAADPAQIAALHDLLLDMSYQDPEVKPLFDLEGLTAWREARLSGYGHLEEAVDRLCYYQDLSAQNAIASA